MGIFVFSSWHANKVVVNVHRPSTVIKISALPNGYLTPADQKAIRFRKEKRCEQEV